MKEMQRKVRLTGGQQAGARQTEMSEGGERTLRSCGRQRQMSPSAGVIPLKKRVLALQDTGGF